MLMLQAVLSHLMLLSLVSAIVASLTLNTYSPKHPKRVFLQHLTRDTADGQQIVYAAASSDATDVNVALKGMQLAEVDSFGNEWLVSYQ